MIAAMNNNIGCVRLLLMWGANKEIRDSDGCTALLLAVANEHTHVVEELLNSGADINAKDKVIIFIPIHLGEPRIVLISITMHRTE